MRTSPSSYLSTWLLTCILALSVVMPLSEVVGAEKKVNINTASMEQLLAVQGIGQSTAENILAYIKKHGPFHNIEDVQEVKGIGKARVETLKKTFTAKPPDTKK